MSISEISRRQNIRVHERTNPRQIPKLDNLLVGEEQSASFNIR